VILKCFLITGGFSREVKNWLQLPIGSKTLFLFLYRLRDFFKLVEAFFRLICLFSVFFFLSY
ncbi:hypothetical protein HMPREF1400_00938, partial [Helicobacter pylori GAM119Bi]